MTTNKINARLAARKILAEAGIASCPVNPYSLIKSYCGTRISKIDLNFFNDLQGNMPEGWTTIFQDRAAVFINSSHIYTRNRWTAAHELAHIVLGHPLFAIAEFDAKRDPALEREADIFAEELLLPLYLIKNYIAQHEVKSMDQMANAFHVSYKAMSIRLKKILPPTIYRNLVAAPHRTAAFVELIDTREIAPIICSQCGTKLYPTKETYSLVCACGMEFHFADGDFIDELFGP